MDSLAELQRRKAELRAQAERQREGLKKSFSDARDGLEPGALLRRAVSGLFNSKKEGTAGADKLTGPVAFLADLLLKDPRLAFLVKTVAPVAVGFFSKKTGEKAQTAQKAAPSEKPESHENQPPPTEEPPERPFKARALGQLRRGVGALRGFLKDREKAAAQPPDPGKT